MNRPQTGNHRIAGKDSNMNEYRMESLFGEALGDKPTATETEQELSSFLFRRKKAARRRRIYGLAIGTAAAILVLLCVIPPFSPDATQTVEVFTSLEVPQEITINELGEQMIVTTPPATTTTVHLSDGTQVMLNANSRLAYQKNFTDTLRIVTLTGEARFDVAKDPSRAFIVHTEHLQTQVLGTVFNIKAYPQSRPDVTLYEGKVHISSTDRKQSRDMKPGEQASLDKRGKLHLEKLINPEAGWTKGEFSFDNTELMQVMQEIGTWYNISIVFHSRPLLQERIYFRINRQLSVDKVLEALNDLKIAQFKINEGKIVVATIRPS